MLLIYIHQDSNSGSADVQHDLDLLDCLIIMKVTKKLAAIKK